MSLRGDLSLELSSGCSKCEWGCIETCFVNPRTQRDPPAQSVCELIFQVPNGVSCLHGKTTSSTLENSATACGSSLQLRNSGGVSWRSQGERDSSISMPPCTSPRTSRRTRGSPRSTRCRGSRGRLRSRVAARATTQFTCRRTDVLGWGCASCGSVWERCCGLARIYLYISRPVQPAVCAASSSVPCPSAQPQRAKHQFSFPCNQSFAQLAPLCLVHPHSLSVRSCSSLANGAPSPLAAAEPPCEGGSPGEALREK
jgi:hypothetical protein